MEKSATWQNSKSGKFAWRPQVQPPRSGRWHGRQFDSQAMEAKKTTIN